MNEILISIVLITIAVAIGGILLLKPKLGLYLFLVFAPFSYFYAYLSPIPLAAGSLLQKSLRDLIIIVLYFIWLFHLIIKKELGLPAIKPTLIALLFVLIALIQTIRVFPLSGFTALIGLRNTVEFIPLIIIVPLFFSKNTDDLKRIIDISIICALIVACLGFYELYLKLAGFDPSSFLKSFNSFRIRSTLFNPNNLGYFQSTVLLLLLGLYFQKDYVINKLFSQLAGLALFASLLTSFSRGALFGFLIGFSYLLIVSKKIRTFLAISFVFIAFLLMINSFFPLSMYRYYSLFEQGAKAESVQGRTAAITSNTEYLSNNPLVLFTGIGFDKIGSVVDIDPSGGEGSGKMWMGAGSPDNYYVLLLMGGGLVSLIVFLAVLFVLIKEAAVIAIFTNVPIAKGLAFGIGSVFVAYTLFGFTVDLWGTFPCNFYFWLLAGMLLSIKRMAIRAA